MTASVLIGGIVPSRVRGRIAARPQEGSTATHVTTSAPADPWTAAADPDRRIGHAVEFVPVIGSTNDRARALLDEPGGEGTVVVADLQTAGRGRLGRSWQSPPGRNLTLSIGLRPRVTAADAWLLSAAAALAVLDAAAPYAALSLKWPNDLV